MCPRSPFFDMIDSRWDHPKVGGNFAEYAWVSADSVDVCFGKFASTVSDTARLSVLLNFVRRVIGISTVVQMFGIATRWVITRVQAVTPKWPLSQNENEPVSGWQKFLCDSTCHARREHQGRDDRQNEAHVMLLNVSPYRKYGRKVQKLGQLGAAAGRRPTLVLRRHPRGALESFGCFGIGAGTVADHATSFADQIKERSESVEKIPLVGIYPDANKVGGEGVVRAQREDLFLVAGGGVAIEFARIRFGTHD